MSFTVEVDGLDEVEAKLGKIAAKQWVKGTLTAAANDLISQTAPYPPAPPYTGRSWYERGYGPRWRVKDGSIHGRKTSQDLGAKWRITPRSSEAVMIENTATYSGFVHDKNTQVGFHAARGWRTIQDMWEKHGSAITKKFQDAINDILRS